jgi:hypothetical protein
LSYTKSTKGKWFLKSIKLYAADTTKYMVISRDQNVGRSHRIKIDSFEWVEEFKYLGTPFTTQNSIQAEIKS